MSPVSTLRRGISLSCIGLVPVLALIACGRGSETTVDTAAAASDAATPATPATSALNDAQIAHVAVTANSIDSAMGELAKPKARNAQVRGFAETMIRDHGAVNKQAVALAQRLNVTPEDNDISRQLQQGADAARGDLGGRSGADFDRAYLEREVQYHQAVLDALDQTLIPGAQNADLKTLLQQVRPNIAQHLELARQTQRGLTAQ